MKNIKNKKMILSLFIIGVIFIVTGVSYAFLSYAGMGNNTNNIIPGDIVFNYKEGTNNIMLNEAMPMTDQEGMGQNNYFEFEIKADTPEGVEIPYYIAVRKSVSSDNVDDAIKLGLTKVDTNGKEEIVKIDNYNSLQQYQNANIDLSKYTEKLLYDDNILENTNYTQKYRLRAWIDENADFTQAKYVNASFSLSVNVYSNGIKKLAPGLYDSNDNLLASWNELVNNYGLDVETDNSSNSYSKLLSRYDIFEQGTKLILGDVTKIGKSAFERSSNLTSIEIPDSVESIGSYAFFGTSIESITIPSSMTEIGNNSLGGMNLKEIEIPAQITSIGDYAFHLNHSLTKVTFAPGSQLTAMGMLVFSYCDDLKYIEIPDSVTSIGERAFDPAKVLIYHGTATDDYSNNWGADYLNSYVEGDFAYEDSTKKVLNAYLGDYTSVVIPNTVEKINSYAFSGLDYLEKVQMPDSVTVIANHAFGWCQGLTTINIPNGVTEIGQMAFYDNASLTSLIIPSSVTKIGSSAFAWCSNLNELNIPSSVADIGRDAFYKVPHVYYTGAAGGSPWGALELN